MRSILKSDKYEKFFVLCISLISFLVQTTKTYFFPPKYFYDAMKVFEHIGEDNLFNIGDSYEITYFLFSAIQKVFNFSTMQQWNVAIWIVIGIPTIALLYRKILKYNKGDFLIWGMCFGYMMLLPIFCWSTQKEVFQYIFVVLLLVCADFCDLQAYMTKRSIIMVGSLLLAWGIMFRSYYLLIACLFLMFEIILCSSWEKYTKKTLRKIIMSAVWIIIGAFLFMYLCKANVIFQIFESRMSVNQTRIGSNDANTIILDWINNSESFLFLHVINYFINAFRLLFPFELILKGKKYIVYIGIQLFMSTMLVVGGKNLYYVTKEKLEQKKDCIPNKIKILLGVMFAWYMVAFIFEPDFGSFLRHQVAMFPVFCPIYCYNLGKRKKSLKVQEC